MLDWLDGGVVVVLVDLTVDCPLDVLLLRSNDSFILDGWVYRLMDCSFMLSISREKIGNGCLCFIHLVRFYVNRKVIRSNKVSGSVNSKRKFNDDAKGGLIYEISSYVMHQCALERPDESRIVDPGSSLHHQ